MGWSDTPANEDDLLGLGLLLGKSGMTSVTSRKREAGRVEAMIATNGVVSLNIAGNKVEIDTRSHADLTHGFRRLVDNIEATLQASDRAQAASKLTAEGARTSLKRESEKAVAASRDVHRLKRELASRASLITAKDVVISDLRMQVHDNQPTPTHETQELKELEGAPKMAQMDNTEDPRETQPQTTEKAPGALRTAGGNMADGLKVVAQMGASRALSMATAETLVASGLPREALKNPFIKALIDNGTPALLRVLGPQIPGFPEGATAALDHIQVGAMATTGGEAIAAIEEHAAPVFRALMEQGKKLSEITDG